MDDDSPGRLDCSRQYDLEHDHDQPRERQHREPRRLRVLGTDRQLLPSRSEEALRGARSGFHLDRGTRRRQLIDLPTHRHRCPATRWSRLLVVGRGDRSPDGEPTAEYDGHESSGMVEQSDDQCVHGLQRNRDSREHYSAGDLQPRAQVPHHARGVWDTCHPWRSISHSVFMSTP